MKVRRAVLGDEHVDRATANATDFTRPFQEFITRGAWGDVWTRPGLDRRTRSVITLSVLIALRAEHEIGMHIKGALRNGLEPDEIRELIITRPYTRACPPPTARWRSPRRSSMRESHFVQSLERGLAVIRAFDADHPELTLSDVARETGLTRAAARRFC
jgi:alkylhydroperoxidase/carboxymuconolactone decarboxylase family protein YurZ